MLVGERFWNSITMKPKEYKAKYEIDSKFWNEYGYYVYQRMIRDNAKKVKEKVLSKKEQWLNS